MVRRRIAVVSLPAPMFEVVHAVSALPQLLVMNKQERCKILPWWNTRILLNRIKEPREKIFVIEFLSR